ncbi:MAG: hypothetical protein RLZZ621_918 [Gemmatimonadota bacterium]|jgi:hypothetical protein
MQGLRAGAVRRRIGVGALWIATAVLAACQDATGYTPTVNRYAALNMVGRTAGNGEGQARITAIFFDALTLSVPNSALQQSDQCTLAAVDTLTLVTRGEKKLLTTPTLAIGGVPATLIYRDSLARYEPTESTVRYRAGDLAQFTIPADAAFPGGSLSVKLAEPVLPGKITVPTVGQSMNVTWNGTNDPTAAIILSLRYANPVSSPYANEQVYCALRDDGVHDFTPVALTNFYNSPPALRSLTITRWRTSEALPDARSLLHLASSFDTTVAIR